MTHLLRTIALESHSKLPLKSFLVNVKQLCASSFIYLIERK